MDQLDAQYVKQFARFLAEQQERLTALNESFTRHDAALSTQGEHGHDELQRQLAELEQDYASKQEQLQEQLSAEIAALRQQSSAALDKASNAFQREQQKLRDAARDNKDYDASVEQAKEKTFSEVNKKHEDFTTRADAIEQQVQELVQKLPDMPSSKKAKRLKLEGRSLFNRLADLKKQVDDLNDAVASQISLSARIVASKLLTIIQQVVLLVVFLSVGYLLYQNVSFPNPYVIPSIVAGAWFAFALWLFIARFIRQRRRVKRLVEDTRYAVGALETLDDLRAQAQREYDPEAAIDENVDRLLKQHERERERSQRKQDKAKKEIATLRQAYEAEQEQIKQQGTAELAAAEARAAELLKNAELEHQTAIAEAQQALEEEQRQASQETYDQRAQCLQERDEIFAAISDYSLRVKTALRHAYQAWDDQAYWQDWTPAESLQQHVPLAHMQIDYAQLIKQRFMLDAQETQCALPIDLMLPEQSLLLCQMRAEQGMPIIHQAMLRLLTNMPIGRVRFTLIDPRALGEHFSQFLRLVDFDEHIVGPKVWTAQNEIEQVLKQLTEHAEKVIQKFLRHQYQTLGCVQSGSW